MDRFLLLRQYDAHIEGGHFAMIASFKYKAHAIKYAQKLGGAFRIVDDNNNNEIVKEWTTR